MYPVILKIGPIAIHSWGVMLACSVLVGIWLSTKRAENRDLQPEIITDVALYTVIAGIIGARLYYAILHFEEFKGEPLLIINPFAGEVFGFGGLVLYGGLIGAIGAGYLYFHLRKISFLDYADVIAPSIGFGIFLTRIGCFLNGCCYGRPTELFLGVHFPPNSAAGAFQSTIAAKAGTTVSVVKLFPSQLFMSIGGLIIALSVLYIGRRRLFRGFEFYVVIVLYAIDRFMIDFTRYYAPNEKLAFLSHNQLICIALFVVFGGLVLKNAVVAHEDL